jgi:hypothetical protein
MTPDLMAPVTWDGGAPKWHAVRLRLLDGQHEPTVANSGLRPSNRDARHNSLDELLRAASDWAAADPRIAALALLGSHARAVGKPGSCLPHERRSTPLRLEAAAT